MSARIRRLIRRTITAAHRAGTALVTAVRGSHFGLLIRLFAAIDAGAAVRIRYTDRHGTTSVRDITPRRLWASGAGDILVTAWDWRDQDEAHFRTDRITAA